MEPGLRDRENPTGRRPAASGGSGSGRNGARPERPGKRGDPVGAGHARQLAAMEPGLRDRENPVLHQPGAVRRPAAMEPGLRDRENPAEEGGGGMTAPPQWSPA